MTPKLGTNGVEKRIPLLGDTQAVLWRFTKVRPGAVELYAVGLALAAAGLLSLLLVARSESIEVPIAVAGLAAVGAIAERGRVRLPGGMEASISLLPCLFTVVLFGPLAGMLVGGASFLGQITEPRMKWITYTSARTVIWGLTGLAVEAVGSSFENQVGAITMGATVGTIISQSLDAANTAVIFRLRRFGPMREALATVAPLAAAAVPLFTPVVILLVLAYSHLSPWTLALFFVPALGAQRLFILYQEQRQLAEDFSVINRRLERANLSFATALVATLDERDRYTAGHSAAVAIYARDISRRLGLDEAEQQLAHLCGLVHDIGKIGLPPGLLEKPGALTLDERRRMQEHSAIGERILRNVEDYAEIAAVVRHHHERWDGEGYPDGLAAQSIPLLSRIIAVADAYDAMTSDRPYRDAMPSRVARMRLAQAVESQFDTSVVAAFEAVLAGSNEAYRLGRRGDFNLRAQNPWALDENPMHARVA